MKVPKLILQVAITGTDTKPSQSPYIPITPDEAREMLGLKGHDKVNF